MLLYDTLLDLVARDNPRLRSDRPLFSKGYRPYPRTMVVRDGEGNLVDYDSIAIGDKKDHLEMTRVNLGYMRRHFPGRWSRIWAHRVDSLAKLLEAKRYFSGVELDVVFDATENRFFVRHPPDEHACGNRRLGAVFLHAYKASRALCRSPTPSCSDLAERIAERATSLETRDLSFDIRALPFMLENQQRLNGFGWLTWDMKSNSARQGVYNLDIGNDIEVILGSFPSVFSY